MLRVPPSRAAAQALKGRSAAPLGLRMRAGEQGHRRRSYPWGPPHQPAAGGAHSIIRVLGAWVWHRSCSIYCCRPAESSPCRHKRI